MLSHHNTIFFVDIKVWFCLSQQKLIAARLKNAILWCDTIGFSVNLDLNFK